VLESKYGLLASIVLMDNFINLAKQGMDKFANQGQNDGEGRGEYNIQGGEQYNAPHYDQGGRNQGYRPSGQGEEFQHGRGQRIGPDGKFE